MYKGLAKFVSTWFYLGLIPFAPGTFGTLGAIPLYYLLAQTSTYIYVVATVLIIFISIWSAGVAEDIFQKQDPGQVVVDEVSGYLITMLLVPPTVTNIVIGFFLFRLFDITKPPPVRSLERLHGGAGIVLDDVAAGVYSCVSLHLIIKYVL